MRFMTWAAAVLLMFFVTPILTQAADTALPARENLHIYLLCGQSNMAGRGKPEAEDTTPHPRVLVFGKENAWAPAKDPLHWDKPIAGVGPGFSFAKAMAEKEPGVTIGLVPCAVGGTPIERWQSSGDLFKAAIARAKLAAPSGTIKGVIWHQGEANSKDSTEVYAAKLKSVVEAFRKELGDPELPFVCGTLGDFYKNNASVNAALRALPSAVPNTGCADAAGLGHKGDSVHFDTAAQREFGKRYAAAMQGLKSK
jgi:hypothetical protein